MTEREARNIGRLVVLFGLLILRIVVSIGIGKQYGGNIGVVTMLVLSSLGSIEIHLHNITEKDK